MFVNNSQTSCFVSVPGQSPGRSSRGDSVGLRLQLVVMVQKQNRDRIALRVRSAFLCLPGPNENPFSTSKYIEKSFFNAMKAGHHKLMLPYGLLIKLKCKRRSVLLWQCG